MSLKYGKAQVKVMVEAIDQDHATAEDAALAALEAAEQIFEQRALFTVVGQLSGTPDRGTIPASDPEAIKLALGWYSTEGDARSAAESWWTSSASGDTFRTWVLNVHHGTPAELHAERKQHYVALEAKQDDAKRARQVIERQKRAEDAEFRAKFGGCKSCGHHRWEHKQLPIGTYPCGDSACSCKAWVEPDPPKCKTCGHARGKHPTKPDTTRPCSTRECDCTEWVDPPSNTRKVA